MLDDCSFVRSIRFSFVLAFFQLSRRVEYSKFAPSLINSVCTSETGEERANERENEREREQEHIGKRNETKGEREIVQ